MPINHVLAAVRDLTRLELVTEAARAALEEVARTAGHLLVGLVDEDWGRRYGRPVRLGKNPTRPKTRALTPSAYNPDVTQSNIHSTICVSGWTATVRPPTSHTNPLKAQGTIDYGYSCRVAPEAVLEFGTSRHVPEETFLRVCSQSGNGLLRILNFCN
ncbi:hypothetical protein ACFV2N_28495 [Streptomyces sp. NPDC059680]|uniref:hypothetical protein n=1 Tax=Streptomyces sp. NPDC059680 TaxID=3346904 RepID=UPI0036856DF3